MKGCRARPWRVLLAASLLTLTPPPWVAAGEPPKPPAIARVRIEWAVQASSARPLRGVLELSPLPPAGATSERRSLPVEDGAPLVMELPAGSRWQVAVALQGYWGHRVLLEAGAAGTESTRPIALWPAGTITGAVRMADPREALPKSLVVEILASPIESRHSAAAAERLACPVDAARHFSCELPAISADLSLGADGFIPQYRWGTAIAAGKTSDAGTVELVRGASVSGWATAEEGAIAPGRCTASLVPLVAPGGGRIGLRIEETAAKAAVQKSGFFQLRGVAPGSYLLAVEQAGFAAARAFPIEVWPGAETVVKQPLVLRRPLTLEFAIEPPLDWLGYPWRVRVVRFSDFSANLEREPAFAGKADSGGRLRVPGQSAGHYVVDISDSLGNSLYADPQLMVSGPADARQEIAIDLVTVFGRLALGKEPLAGTIWFGTPRSSPGIKMMADEKGRFQGVLPRAGRWPVEIDAAAPALHTVRSVRVRPDAAGRAKVEIALPNVRVFGRVVDEEGTPVAGAQVGIEMEGASADVRTEADGAFSSRGLAEGLATLVAAARSPQGPSRSDPRTAFLREDEVTGPIELQLRRMRTVTGTVASPLGPVVGAEVAAMPVGVPEVPIEAGHTSFDGGFTVQVPAGTESAFLYVSAPGQAFRAFAVRLDGSPLALAVEPDGGTIEVAVPYTKAEMEELELSPPWVVQNGVPIPPALLRKWSFGHGEPYADPGYTHLRIGNLAPGDYRVCFVTRAQVIAAHGTGWTNPSGICAAGGLAAGATLRLTPEAGRPSPPRRPASP